MAGEGEREEQGGSGLARVQLDSLHRYAGLSQAQQVHDGAELSPHQGQDGVCGRDGAALVPPDHPKNQRVFGCFSLVSHGAESKGGRASKRPAKGELVTQHTPPQSHHHQPCPSFLHFPATPAQAGSSRTDFLGMSLASNQATAGGWVLLALALILLITTIFLGVKFFSARKKAFKSSSEMELK